MANNRRYDLQAALTISDRAREAVDHVAQLMNEADALGVTVSFDIKRNQNNAWDVVMFYASLDVSPFSTSAVIDDGKKPQG